MKENAIKVLLNPIRIRIIQELSLKERATTKEIQKACGNISQATLYRHINKLLTSEIIQVVDENIINGITERVYAIKNDISEEISKHPENFTKEEYYDIFSQFIISILTDLSNYMSKETVLENIMKSSGLYSSTLFLTDEELKDMYKEIRDAISKRMNNELLDGRKLRKVSTIITTIL